MHGFPAELLPDREDARGVAGLPAPRQGTHFLGHAEQRGGRFIRSIVFNFVDHRLRNVGVVRKSRIRNDNVIKAIRMRCNQPETNEPTPILAKKGQPQKSFCSSHAPIHSTWRS